MSEGKTTSFPGSLILPPTRNVVEGKIEGKWFRVRNSVQFEITEFELMGVQLKFWPIRKLVFKTSPCKTSFPCNLCKWNTYPWPWLFFVQFFSRPLRLFPAPTNCPWVSDALFTAVLFFNASERKCEGGARGVKMVGEQSARSTKNRTVNSLP